MNFLRKVIFRSALIIAVASMSLTSCVSYKNQIFFQGLQDTSYTASMQQPDPIIQRGDQLSIRIYTQDDEAEAFYNSPMGGMRMGGNNMGGMGTLMGYLVDEEGEIEFPKLGTIKVLGYTQPQLRDSIRNWISPYVKEPIVNVRLLNFRVTFINSNRANTVTIMNNKTNILQFLGSVGGVEWMDKRQDILLVRQVDSLRTVFRLNLADKSIFQSPGFYLQPNDIVYVEPNKRRFLETNAQLINLITGLTGALSLMFVLFKSFL